MLHIPLTSSFMAEECLGRDAVGRTARGWCARRCRWNGRLERPLPAGQTPRRDGGTRAGGELRPGTSFRWPRPPQGRCPASGGSSVFCQRGPGRVALWSGLSAAPIVDPRLTHPVLMAGSRRTAATARQARSRIGTWGCETRSDALRSRGGRLQLSVETPDRSGPRRYQGCLGPGCRSCRWCRCAGVPAGVIRCDPRADGLHRAPAGRVSGAGHRGARVGGAERAGAAQDAPGCTLPASLALVASSSRSGVGRRGCGVPCRPGA